MNDTQALLSNLSRAMLRLTTGASSQLGGDCITQAILAQALLLEHGLATQLVVGQSGWKLGPNSDDSISHLLGQIDIKPGSPPRFGFHAWLETDNGWLLDITTASLPLKAKQMDAQDGYKTTITWGAPYIWAPYPGISLLEFARSTKPGTYFYETSSQIMRFITKSGPIPPVDQDDLRVLRFLTLNSEVQFIGTNDIQHH